MLGSYESAAPYGTSAFYRLLISRSVLDIWSVKVWFHSPKLAISLYFLYYFFAFSKFWFFGHFLPPGGPKFHFFASKGVKNGQKTKILKKWFIAIVWLTFVHNWSKFQLSSIFLAKLVLKNVFLRYRNFSKNKGFSLILTIFRS